MKSIKIYISVLFLLLLSLNSVKAQYVPNGNDFCGVTGSAVTSSTEDIMGGRYKPAVSNIGGAPEGEDYFPALVLFVQFDGETGGSGPHGTTTGGDAWVGGQAPNFMSSTISISRQPDNSSWWNSYNGYDLSDYWCELSRGKLHVIGKAYSVILPHTESWYNSNGGQGKMNKDIMDIIKEPSFGINWPFYDKWTTNGDGSFTWAPDGRVDMIYKIHRKANLATPGHYGQAGLGACDGTTSNEYTVYTSGSTTIKVNFTYGGNGSGFRVQGRDYPANRDVYLDIATHEMGHYLFGDGHITYSKMAFGGGREFGFSAWDMVKMNYIVPRIADYGSPVNVLGDFSSRYGSAGDEGEVIQVPINSTGSEFFLIANRRKVSDYDNRIAGDTLGDDGMSFLRPRNAEIGKGLYIYHITEGYEWSGWNDQKMDGEYADGLWNWINSNQSCSPAWSQYTSHPVFIHDLNGTNNGVSYENDYSSGNPSYSNSDEVSFYGIYSGSWAMGLWYSQEKLRNMETLLYGVQIETSQIQEVIIIV